MTTASRKTAGAIEPGLDADRPPSQPRSKIAWTAPSAAAIESRFMTAAWRGMSSDRKTTSRRSAERRTTTAMK